MKSDQNRYTRTSGRIAKTRTKLTIASDRLDCNQAEMTQMQEEVVNILSKYLNLDSELFDIRIEIINRTKRGVKDVKTIQIK